MDRRSSSRKGRKPNLDVDGFLDILGLFSAEPAGGHPFTLAPLSAVCLSLSGNEIREKESGFILDSENLEAHGVTHMLIDIENIGLDVATISVEYVAVGIFARLPRKTVSLETGQRTGLCLGILGPGAPGLTVESEVLLHVQRGEKILEVPITVRAMSRLIGPSPRFLCDGSPCPAEFDFGSVEARDLIDIDGQKSRAPFFRCTVENLGGESCDLSASIEGEGFELTVTDRNGTVTTVIPPDGSVHVAVKPVFAPLGPHHAILRLLIAGMRQGTHVVSVRLVAEVKSSGPLFTLCPQTDRVKVIRGHRGTLPVAIANLGSEPVHITVFPVLGERMLRGTELDLPADDGSVPTVLRASVVVEPEDIPAGEHVMNLATDSGVLKDLESAASVVLLVEDVIVEPSELDFGAIPLGKNAEKEVMVFAPSDLITRLEVAEELARVVSVVEIDGGHFIVRVNNDPRDPYEPRYSAGAGLKITVPSAEFARQLPVSFRRMRPSLIAPSEIDFGSAPAGGAVSVKMRLANEGDGDLQVRASSTDASVSINPAEDLVIPAGAERTLSVGLSLPEAEPEPNSDGTYYTTTIVLTTELPRESRHIPVTGRVVFALGRMCPFCKAVSKPQSKSCWFCSGSLADALLATVDMVGQCPDCGGLFSSDYSFCPTDGGDIVPFVESS